MADDFIRREDAERTIFSEYGTVASQDTIWQIVETLRRVPAADVRELVICAECRYYSEKRRECGHINGLSEIVFPTDYCIYGSKPMMDGEG